MTDRGREEEEANEGVSYEDIEEGDEILGSDKKPPINITGRVGEKVYVEKSND